VNRYKTRNSQLGIWHALVTADMIRSVPTLTVENCDEEEFESLRYSRSGGGLVPDSFCTPGADRSPANDSQTQSTPAPDTSANTQTQTSFSGTVVKIAKHYALKTDSGTFQLDDQAKAKQFVGKQVNVSGTLDKSTSMIRVSDIQSAS
jgi:Protein of unknown function (DUF5818)